MTYPVAAIGTRLTADFLNSMLPLTARKSGTTTRTSTAVSAADPELFLPVEANAVYMLQFYLKFDAAIASDIRWNWTFPTGATGSYSLHAILVGSVTGAATDDINIHYDLSATGGSGGEGAGTDKGVIGLGMIATSSTSGTLAFTWAQFTSGATGTNLKANSFIQLKRVA